MPTLNTIVKQMSSRPVTTNEGVLLNAEMELSRIFRNAARQAGQDAWSGFSSHMRGQLQKMFDGALTVRGTEDSNAPPTGSLSTTDVRFRLDRTRLAKLLGEEGLLDKIDVDGDSHIAVDELLVAMDYNRDGTISVDEFEHWFRDHMNIKSISFEQWASQLNTDDLLSVLARVDRVEKNDVKNGTYNVHAALERMGRASDGKVPIFEFVDALLHPERGQSTLSRAGDVIVTLEHGTSSPSIYAAPNPRKCLLVRPRCVCGTEFDIDDFDWNSAVSLLVLAYP